MRTITAMTASPDPEGGYDVLYAACNDGTVWWLIWKSNHPDPDYRRVWERIESIPQDD